MELKKNLKIFIKFLKEDSWESFFVSLILMVFLVYFVVFPISSWLTGTSLPVVIVESCSMYHGDNFDDWWDKNKDWYIEQNITKKEFESFTMKNGFNKGDLIFIWGRGEYSLGDIIIFEQSHSTAKYPIIHRIISENPYGTKGDNNAGQITPHNSMNNIDEQKIYENEIVGEAKFRIPLIGWIKLIFFEPFRSASERGLCVQHNINDIAFS